MTSACLILNLDLQEYEDELRRFKAHFKEMVQRQEKVVSKEIKKEKKFFRRFKYILFQIFSMGPVDPERHLFLKVNSDASDNLVGFYTYNILFP